LGRLSGGTSPEKQRVVVGRQGRAVNRPSRNHVNLAGRGVLKQPVEAGALIPPVRAGNAGAS
jgi:hypothetical protein